MKKIVLPLIALFLLVSQLCSQELAEMKIKGKGKTAPEELISKKIRDANGEICAGLMIISDMTGLSYSSYNQIVKITSKPGKDLLFVSPEERVVEVYKSGYKPLKIILNEHGVKLTSGRVWKLELTGDKKREMIPVTITAEPAGCSIFIDNEARGTFRIQQISPGIHTLRLEKEGWKTLTDTINANSRSDFFTYNLKAAEKQPVHIITDPPGARVFLNYADSGITDRRLSVYPGRYHLNLSLANYTGADSIIEVREQQENTFFFRLEKNSAALSLAVSPSDTRVLINNEDYSGRKEIELIPGRYIFDLSRPGYYPISDTLVFEKGSTLKKNYSLTAKKGNFRLSVTPPDAGVRLMQEGKPIEQWSGSKTLRGIKTGLYTLEFARTGYEDLKKEINVEENKTTEERITLKKIQVVQKQPESINRDQEEQPKRQNVRYADNKRAGYNYSHSVFLGAQGLFYPLDAEEVENPFGINMHFGIRISGGFVLGASLSNLKWRKNEGEVKSEYNSWITLAEIKYQFVDALWISLSPGYLKYERTNKINITEMFNNFHERLSDGEFIAAAGAGIDIPMGDILILTASAKYYLTDGPVHDDLIKKGPEIGAGLQLAL